MTVTAESAAFRGDCVAVRMLGQRVRQLDADYFNAAFVTNPVIVGCRQGVAVSGRADAPGGVVGPHFGGTTEIGIGGGIWSADGESLSGPGGPSFGFGSFINPNLALTLRFAGATHIGDGITGWLGFVGPAIQYWPNPQFFIGGGLGLGVIVLTNGDEWDGEKGTGFDFRFGYAFHPKGFSSANISFEATRLSEEFGSISTYSVLLGYQSF